METNRRRERERQREEEGEERESVVNGEQRVFQSGFRPVSRPFWGRSRGLCSFPRKEAELNAPAMKPKQKNQHIIPATKKTK